MKKIFYILVFSIICTSCEDVIEVNVDTEDPRLVIDAIIRVDTDRQTVPVIIKASTTSSFFGESQPAKLDNIYLFFEESNTAILLFELEPGTGIYQPSEDEVNPDEISTELLSSQSVILSITHNGQSYFSRTQFVPTVPIDNISQGEGGIFNGDETELVVTINDVLDREDYYLFDFDKNEYIPSEDTFFDGQTFEFSFFYEDQLPTNEELNISILGIDEDFYNYMNQLIVQSGSNNGPFETPAATVKGNIFNVTEIDNIDYYDNVNLPDNFPLGYFAICQTYNYTFIIE
ncbi:DUF4249 domain-containing protein [Flaviramulus sp. BrNp1-15]|uniref:DUF4249 family protein n=1 Tax=Flaviramulus sp. BrNp1-15 TaxID=2916754 RepID=UPI001EE880E5|nr:DUF4249 family protein [Flaviramulus sp. BrNp1-15]ULC58658.1 DUF4249 domain-containing protein [Flaviramulus sp. BrNp1-15]